MNYCFGYWLAETTNGSYEDGYFSLDDRRRLTIDSRSC